MPSGCAVMDSFGQAQTLCHDTVSWLWRDDPEGSRWLWGTESSKAWNLTLYLPCSVQVPRRQHYLRRDSGKNSENGVTGSKNKMKPLNSTSPSREPLSPVVSFNPPVIPKSKTHCFHFMSKVRFQEIDLRRPKAIYQKKMEGSNTKSCEPCAGPHQLSHELSLTWTWFVFLLLNYFLVSVSPADQDNR